MTDNTGNIQAPRIYSAADECMRAYDQLPRSVRRRLANAPFNLSSVRALQIVAEGGELLANRSIDATIRKLLAAARVKAGERP